MSGDIDVPFTPNPDSTTVRSGSYSIPAGQYAIVTAQVKNGGTFTIDGNTALDSQSGLVAVAVSGTADPVQYTPPANHYFEGQIYAAGNANVTINSVLISGLVSGKIELKAGPSHQISITTGTSDVKTITGYSRVINLDLPLQASFRVPTGTSLNTTGDAHYTVELFNEIQ